MAEGVLEKHLSEIQKAADRLKGVAAETPLMYSTYFSKESGNQIWIKPENLQNTVVSNCVVPTTEFLS